MPIVTRRKRKHSKLTLLAAAALIACTSAPLFADATASQRSEFNKLVSERNSLYLQLRRADRDAAEKIKAGQPADVSHAKQIATQDKLDTATMRVESAAVRYGLAIPPLPDDSALEKTSHDTMNDRTRKTLARGHNRAMDVVREDTKKLLRSIDFTGFLEPEPAPAPADADKSAKAAPVQPQRPARRGQEW